MEKPKQAEVVVPAKKPKPDYELERLRLMERFHGVSGKAQQIQDEWQRIQQDEHNENFAFQVLRGNNEGVYLYKKGISDGIKWCLKNFS